MTFVPSTTRAPPTSDVDRAREQLARLDALIDVLLAQLAHTGSENPRWRRIRQAVAADRRLETSIQVLPSADDAAGQQIAEQARRWLHRCEPALALVVEPLDLVEDNAQLFAAVRTMADIRRSELAAAKAEVPIRPKQQVRRWALIDPAVGLGVLREVLSASRGPTAPNGNDRLDPHIDAMLADADQWRGPQGGRFFAALGLARLAEAALLARHIDPDVDIADLFGRYAGSPDLTAFADVRPDHILAFDSVFARGAALNDPSLRLTEQQLGPESFQAMRSFFESRLTATRALGLRLPNRAFDALDVRIGARRMQDVANTFSAATLERCCLKLGPDALARAIVTFGPDAAVELTPHADSAEVTQQVLTAFGPLGEAMGPLIRRVPGDRLVTLTASLGATHLQRQVAALGADGLKHLVDCVGYDGTVVVLSANAPDAVLHQLRGDIGRRSVRLTLQTAAGTDIAKLLLRGLTAQQIRSLMTHADRSHPTLGSEVIARLAALPGSNEALRNHVETLVEAMQWR